MMYETEFEGILFIEGEPTIKPEILKHVKCSIHGMFFSQAQLKNLNDVKRLLAHKVKASGGNSLINFSYGQKSNFWTTLLGIDNICWYGEGDVVKIDKTKG